MARRTEHRSYNVYVRYLTAAPKTIMEGVSRAAADAKVERLYDYYRSGVVAWSEPTT